MTCPTTKNVTKTYHFERIRDDMMAWIYKAVAPLAKWWLRKKGLEFAGAIADRVCEMLNIQTVGTKTDVKAQLRAVIIEEYERAVNEVA